MKLNTFCFFITILLLTSCNDSSKDMDMPETIKELKSPQKHLAKAQIYRWYQLYERELSDVRINNTMDMLADDIFLKSSAGEMKGKKNYPDRVKVFKGWENAHHVDNIEVNLDENGGLLLEADIRYQNIQPSGDKSSYKIHYNTKLTVDDFNLPNFNSIEIVPTEESQESYVDAYPVNRVKSLMHYWLANMERLDGEVTPFKELLAPDFELNFSTSSKITSIDALKTWLNGTPKQLKESEHTPKDFSIKNITDNEYEVTVFFNWKGVTKEDVKLKAVTKHVWHVLDNINDRFAKIVKVDVTQISPFEVVE